MQLYYKLYYPKEYYEEMLSNVMYEYIDEAVYKYTIDDIKEKYYKLNESTKLSLPLKEHEELELLQILIEMYERSIKYNIKNGKIEIGE